MDHESNGSHSSRNEGKPAGTESDPAWKAKAKPSGKRHYVPPRLVEYGNIADLRMAGRQDLADLFKKDE